MGRVSPPGWRVWWPKGLLGGLVGWLVGIGFWVLGALFSKGKGNECMANGSSTSRS